MTSHIISLEQRSASLPILGFSVSVPGTSFCHCSEKVTIESLYMKLGIVSCACNPSTWKTERTVLNLRPIWAMQGDPVSRKKGQ
jgi:hypothetical protein